MMQKANHVKAYYATNTSSLTNSIGRKKSVTAVARQQGFNQHQMGTSGANLASLTSATSHTNPSQQTHHTSGSLTNL